MRTATTVAVLLALAFHSASGDEVQIDAAREARPLQTAPREIVVDREGTGDVTSIQAGIRLIATLRESEAVSSVLTVLPGFYDEEVTVQNDLGPMTINCPKGSAATRVRRVMFERDGDGTIGEGFEFIGLGIVERVHATAYRVGMYWRHCRFEGGYTSHVESIRPNMVACEFNANSELTGYYGGDFDSLVVRGARLRLIADAVGGVGVTNSTFEGPGDTALVVASHANVGVGVSNCTFVGYDYGVIAEPLPYYAEVVSIIDSHFEVHRVGVGFKYEGAYSSVDLHGNGLGLVVARTTFKGGESAIRWEAGTNLFCLGQVDIQSPRGDAIVANLGILGSTIRDVSVTGAGGRGMVFRTDPNLPWSSIRDCRILDSGGDGLVIEDPDGELYGLTVEGTLVSGSGGAGFRLESTAPNRSGADFPHVKLRRNTVVLNKGDGMQLETLDSLFVSATNNLVAGNDGVGMHVKGLATYLMHGNDSWANAEGDYRGDPVGPDNVSVDPGFCDPLAGDWHVQSGSVCAPDGPVGQIGAFGVGCEASRVEAAIRGGHPINTGSNAKVPLTVFGHRLFDAGSLAPTGARLAGVAPESWATEDSNGDGFPDLVLSFRARDMAVGGGDGDSLFNATLEHGNRVFTRVAMRQVPGRKDLTAIELAPERLAIESVRVSEQGGLRAAISTYPSDRATLELFDLAGRRLAREVIEFRSGGESVVELATGGGLKSGVYFMRLAQRQELVTQNVVVVR